MGYWNGDLLKPMKSVNQEVYSVLEDAIEHFNETLFKGELPSVVLTLQRDKNVMGYCSHKRWVGIDGSMKTEIAINPEYVACEPLVCLFQTIVHELCHLWQYEFGKPGRGRYHNKEWANKMESIGLMASSTGKPGGKKTGDRMNDYPIKGGLFLNACRSLVEENKFTIKWTDRYQASSKKQDEDVSTNDIEDQDLIDEALNTKLTDMVDAKFIVNLSEEPKVQTRAKYSCESCGANVWGKFGLNLVCKDCNCSFTES